MLSRPFRFLQTVLAALGLLILRPCDPLVGRPDAVGVQGAEQTGVVFRHYL